MLVDRRPVLVALLLSLGPLLACQSSTEASEDAPAANEAPPAWVGEVQAELDALEKGVLAGKSPTQFFEARAGGPASGVADVSALAKAVRAIESAELDEVRPWLTHDPEGGAKPPPRPGEEALRAAHAALAPVVPLVEKLDGSASLVMPLEGLDHAAINRQSQTAADWSAALGAAIDRAHLGALVQAEGWEAELVRTVRLVEKQRHPHSLIVLMVQTALVERAWRMVASIAADAATPLTIAARDELLALRRDHAPDVADAIEGELIVGIALTRAMLDAGGEVPPQAEAQLDVFGRGGQASAFVTWVRAHPGQTELPPEFAELGWAQSMSKYLTRASDMDASAGAAVAKLEALDPGEP